MAFDYSVMLDLEDKVALVVGGGAVAKRKIKDLIDVKAKVIIISPSLTDQTVLQNKSVKYINRAFQLEDIVQWKPFIVFAATNDIKLNRIIADYCNKNQILVNSISDPKLGNLSVQAKIEKEQFCVSVSTYGKGPGFSRTLKKHLEQVLDDKLDLAVQIYIDIREWLFTKYDDSSIRVEYLRRLSLEEILRIIEKENLEYNDLLERVKEWLSCS